MTGRWPISRDLVYLKIVDVYYDRGVVYQELGEKEKAIMDFRRCLERKAAPEWREKAEKRLRELGVLL